MSAPILGTAQRIAVVLSIVVGRAGNSAMNVGSAQFLSGHLFPSGRFYQRGAAQKDCSLVADDNGLITHGRNIGAAGCAGTHHGGNLVDAARGHDGLVVEDASKVVAIREHFRLER